MHTILAGRSMSMPKNCFVQVQYYGHTFSSTFSIRTEHDGLYISIFVVMMILCH